jgi:hypothetical protein
MPAEPQRRERQMTLWESDGRIVPLRRAVQACATKLGNASGGKAAKPTRAADRTPPTRSGRDAVLNRLERITALRVTGVGWEPDALTAHVRF